MPPGRRRGVLASARPAALLRVPAETWEPSAREPDGDRRDDDRSASRPASVNAIDFEGAAVFVRSKSGNEGTRVGRFSTSWTTGRVSSGTADAPEESWRRSLLYPLWDFSGITFLAVFSILWWFVTLATFGYLTMVLGGQAFGGLQWGLFFPAILGQVVLLGFTLLYLGEVLISSATGEVHHPHWPDGDLFEIIRRLLRWFWALLIGAFVGLFPAVWYWIYCGDLDLLDWIVLVDFLIPGVAYGQMALVASILFDDVLGANPITVGLALWRVGWGSLRPGLIVSVGLFLAGGLLTLILAIANPLAALLSHWAFCVFILYEAMVMMRVLGLEYRRNARKLGWFRESPGRAV